MKIIVRCFLLVLLIASITACQYPFANYYLPQNPSGDINIIPSDGGAVIGEELTANYTGHEPVKYQWYKDSVSISDATEKTFTPTESGSYTVGVTLPGGGDEKMSPPITIL